MKKDKVNLEKYLMDARNLVGQKLEVNFETIAKYNEIAGYCEVVEFEEAKEHTYEMVEFKGYEDEVSSISLGTLKIKFLDTKKYHGKTFTFTIEEYFGLEYNEPKLYISTKKLEDGKYLHAYRFEFIEN